MSRNKEKSRLWRKRNSDKVSIHNRNAYVNMRDKKRDLLNQEKSKPCFDCGVKYNPWVMQFDHIDPKTKSFGIANVRKTISQLKEEIKKCQVVCANCHAERTHKQRLNGFFRKEGCSEPKQMLLLEISPNGRNQEVTL